MSEDAVEDAVQTVNQELKSGKMLEKEASKVCGKPYNLVRYLSNDNTRLYSFSRNKTDF